jgi:hypothetical protein
MRELARALGKEILPLVRAAALGSGEDLAQSALRVLPLFGTRAAADVLAEAYQSQPEGARARLAREGAEALQARGIHVAIPEPDARQEAPELVLRETHVTAPDGVGSRSIVARFQDAHGVWHAVFALWNDQVGIKDGFMRPFSRHEWAERVLRLEERSSAPVACPPDYARWQVARARALNEQTGYPLEDRLRAWDEHVGPPPETFEPPDPTAPVRAADEEARAAWLAGGPALFQRREVRTWFLEAADCVSWSRRWSAVHRRLELRGKDEKLEQELKTVLQGAGEELVQGPLVHRYRDRLLDLSRCYAWRHEDLASRQAAAAAAALDQGTPPAEIPFFLELVQRSMLATEALLARGEDLERARYRPTKRYHS